MNVKQRLGNNIKRLRLKHSLTQEALAEKINLSAKSLSQIELGNNFVSAETLEKICSAINIKPKMLFDFELNENESKDMLKFITDKLKTDKSLLSTIYKIVIALDE